MGDQRRSGIVGSGMIAEVHARAVRAAGGAVAAVVGRNSASAEAAARRYGAERALTDVDELLASEDVEIVHICTPNDLHVPLARKVVAAGKHVICEKPLAVDVVSAREITDEASSAGLVNAVPFVYRFYSSVREARERVLSGQAGPPRLIHGSYLQDWLASPDADNWRVRAGRGGASRAFADIGIHWCDLVEFTTGQRITRLTARMLTAHPVRGGREVDTEDAAGVLFETDGGALGSLVISQVTPGRKNRLWFSIDGEKVSLSFDQEQPEGLWIGAPEANTVLMRGSNNGSSAARFNLLPPGHPQGYQDSFTAFVADVFARMDGHEVEGLPNFEDGLRSATLTEAVVESSKTGSWVEVPA